MNTTTAPIKKYPYRPFRPWPEVETRLAAAQEVGINVSELINEILKDNVEAALAKKSKQLQTKLAKMVRGGGFEPPTPTVSR